MRTAQARFNATNLAEPGVDLVVDAPWAKRRFRVRHLSVQPVAQPAVESAGSFALEPIAFAEELRSTLKLGGSGRRSFKLTNERKQEAQLFFVEFFHAQRPLFRLELQDALVTLTNCFLADIHAATTWRHSFNLIPCIVAERRRFCRAPRHRAFAESSFGPALSYKMRLHLEGKQPLSARCGRWTTRN